MMVSTPASSTLADVCRHVPLFRRFHDEVKAQYPSAQSKQVVYETLNRMLNALVTDLMEEVRTRVADLGATTLDDIRRAPARIAALSPAMEAERAAAKSYLYTNFYNSPGMEEEHERAARVVQELFSVLMADPGLLPADHQAQIPNRRPRSHRCRLHRRHDRQLHRAALAPPVPILAVNHSYMRLCVTADSVNGSIMTPSFWP